MSMGSLNSGRPGGNPDLVVHQFKTDREEALSERLSIRISPSMMKFLKMLDNYPEFIRQAIEEKIERMETNSPPLRGKD